MSKANTAEQVITSLAKAAQLPQCLCILSPDRVRRERAVEYLISSILHNISDKPEIIKVSLRNFKESELQNLENNTRSPSLFSSRSLIIISDIEQANANFGKNILSLIENSLNAEFIITGEKIAKNTTLYKTLKTKYQIAEFSPLKNQSLHSWIKKELARNEISEISNAAIDIISRVGEYNLDIIVSMCGQLALYSENDSISPKDIYALFHQNADPNEFGLPETIVNSNSGELEITIDELIKTGKNAFLLVSRLFWTYAAIGKINGLKSKGFRDSEITSELGISEWIMKKYMTIGKHYNSVDISRCITSIAKADSKLKSKSTGEFAILSELCTELQPRS
ncbi:MAG: DNA polymerase III subunit delta [Bdellovibrionota bacterium]